VSESHPGCHRYMRCTWVRTNTIPFITDTQYILRVGRAEAEETVDYRAL
jgi:hypothetical protein